MKLLALTVLLLGVILYANGLGGNQVQTWGERRYNEARVHYQLLNKSGSIFSFSQKQTQIQFPAKNAYNYRNITRIQVTDQLNDPDCRAIITDGGIGYRYVKLQFQGSGRKGYNFISEIFAV